eukprot:7384103-Prymnesium_polylepis.2
MEYYEDVSTAQASTPANSKPAVEPFGAFGTGGAGGGSFGGGGGRLRNVDLPLNQSVHDYFDAVAPPASRAPSRETATET